MDFVNLVQFKTIGNSDIGFLSFFEPELDFGFLVKRVYFTYDVDSSISRGFHAHKKLRQVLFCPFGRIKVTVNNGHKIKSFLLDKPNIGLVISKGYWREISFLESNSVLIVAASDFFSESDYIRSYDEFLLFVKEGGYL